MTSQTVCSIAAKLRNIVPVCIGLTLIATGLLKCHQLSTSEVAQDSVFTSRSFLATLVILELTLGTLLVAGLYARLARWTSLALFIVFFERSLYLGMAGERSCGCFGHVDVWPWWAAGFDAVAAFFLLIWIPPSHDKMRAAYVSRYALLAGLIIIVSLALVGMTLYTPRGKSPLLRGDPTLSARLKLHATDASTEQLLGQLSNSTGLRYTIDENLAQHIKAQPPNFGVISTNSASGWSIMELIADGQRLPARWAKVAHGYQLVRSPRY